jgi:stearoyl-CoA desaturase (delta-9 desaturase)
MTAVAAAPRALPPPDEPASTASVVVGRIVTGLFVIAPAVILAVALVFLWGHAITLADVIMFAALYLLGGFGVTVGYHRLFTHRSFTPNRWLKLALAGAGSMALEGSVVSWVANHRRHHMFSDQPGDPHSPHGYGPSGLGQIRGLFHAHVGWLFSPDVTSKDRFAPDLLRDPDVVRMGRLFPVFAVLSFAVPFGLGYAISGTVVGALTALLWAGVVRMAVFHHMTWSINSICHMFGRRPFTSKDKSTNFAPLALLSLGESWHSFHHASPSSARHGVLPHQLDVSAGLIRVFERVGWATSVRWPTPASISRYAAS